MNKHFCHAYGCQVEVEPKMFMCRSHWFRVPKELRDRIWALYRPGQELDKQPSRFYLEAARRARWSLLPEQIKQILTSLGNREIFIICINDFSNPAISYHLMPRDFDGYNNDPATCPPLDAMLFSELFFNFKFIQLYNVVIAQNMEIYDISLIGKMAVC